MTTRHPSRLPALLVGTAFLLLGSHLALAQDARPSSQFEELIEVSEVLLDVLVTDRDGNVVVGLGPEDFVVTEGDRELPLTGVSFYSNRYEVQDGAREGLAGPGENEVLSDRYFVFYFHDQLRLGDPTNRIFRQQLEATRQAKRWVEEEMIGGDWVAIVSYDSKLKVHSDFTQDRGRLLEAIDRAGRGKDPSNEWASRRPAEDEVQGPSLLAYLPEGKELRDLSTRMYGGVSLVAEATREIVGRKTLMLFSVGFGEVENIAGGGGGIENFTARPDPRFWPGMIESLNDNNVAVYPVDLTPSEVEHVQSDFLNRLALSTGGQYFENFVSFITPMREIADEANGYYLLSYQASHPAGESGYREVKVETRNPEFEIRARQGYRFGV